MPKVGNLLFDCSLFLLANGCAINL